VGRHAARLEQLAWVRTFADAESLARSLRTACGLYGLDVVVAGSADLAAIACRTAAAPGTSPAVAAGVTAVLGDLPDPAVVAQQPVLRTLIDAMGRTKATLPSGSGVGLVLPGAGDLAAALGRTDARGWCEQVLLCTLREIGAAEPELIVQVGELDETEALGAMSRFYGITLVHAGARPTDGVVAWTPEELTGSGAPCDGWLVTTTDQVAEDADPRAIRALIRALRDGRATESERAAR
jgi:hypothetical protein